MSHPRRRSCLSVPAESERKLLRSQHSPADELVLDLEDSVLPNKKPLAREAVTVQLAAAGRHPQVSVRVNAPRSPWCHRDLLACFVGGSSPSSIVVPKVESAADLEFIDRLLDGIEAESGVETPVGIQALVETAAGLSRLTEIVSVTPRLEALILGYADLSADLGRPMSVGVALSRWLPAQEALLWAARSASLQAVDGPHLAVADDDNLRQAAEWTRDLGFDGKWAIHPNQVATLNEIFTPGADEVDRAIEVLRVFSAQHDGAVALGGTMVDEAVVLRARRLVAQAGLSTGD